jgi:alkylation response protein AidB-like acyl-CoA dehydrogenase
MDLRFSPEENKFREELRTFFREQVPLSLREKVMESRHLSKAELVKSHKILHAKGLAVPQWPKAWGGADWTPVQHYIYTEELQFNGVPQPLPFNVSMCGPVVIAFGTEEQKKRFLPRMAALDDWWCQGFSEPGAGSDLAGLKTTAVRQGAHFIVNGQKTWTTSAQYADWIFCLCRTDPSAKKQLGISFILIDMKTPGITVRPIQTMDGGREVNEVFFDEVKVPAENLVGQEHRGWDCAKFLLGNERTGIARVGFSKQRVQRIKELAGRVKAGDRPLIDDERFREKVAAVEVELKALEMTQMRVLSEERHRKTSTGQLRPHRAISTIARCRSTAAPTRSSAIFWPRPCWASDGRRRRPALGVALGGSGRVQPGRACLPPSPSRKGARARGRSVGGVTGAIYEP